MNKLILGDCLEELNLLPKGSIDLILTDPPYGTTQCKWDSVIPLDKMWDAVKPTLKDNGNILIFGSEPFSSSLRTSNIEMFKYDWIWKKSHATGHLNCKVRPMLQHEIISVFSNPGAKYNPVLTAKPKENIRPAPKRKLTECYGKYDPNAPRSIDLEDNYPRSVLEFNTANHGEKGFHPTQKPINILDYLIRTYTDKNDLVLDFTMGSGSTGVSCASLGRKFIGIEKDPEYFSIAEQRINSAQMGLF